MKSIEERAKEYSLKDFDGYYTGWEKAVEEGYIAGATEQKAIDEEVRLKKCDDMTEAEYNRETAFTDWYHKNGKGTPTYSDAIEWARKDAIDRACKWLCACCPAQIDEDNGLQGCEGNRDSCCPTLDSFINAMDE